MIIGRLMHWKKKRREEDATVIMHEPPGARDPGTRPGPFIFTESTMKRKLACFAPVTAELFGERRRERTFDWLQARMKKKKRRRWPFQAQSPDIKPSHTSASLATGMLVLFNAQDGLEDKRESWRDAAAILILC